MRILALEASGTQGSVAVLNGSEVLEEAHLPPDRRSAQTLLPALKELLAKVGWKPADVQLVAVTQGPGSFTGLRVGVTATKTLAYAVGAEVLGVDTLEVVAFPSAAEHRRLWVVMDAQREQLYAALFSRSSEGELSTVEPTRIVDAERWLAELLPDAVVTGPGLSRWADRLTLAISIAPRETWTPRASAVGQLAWRAYSAGRRDDLWKLAPNYFRASAAEEKRPSLRA